MGTLGATPEAAPHTGELFLRLAEALQAVNAATSPLVSDLSPSPALSMAASGAASSSSAAATTSPAVEESGAATVTAGRGISVAQGLANASVEGEGQSAVLPMEVLALEPPASVTEEEGEQGPGAPKEDAAAVIAGRDSEAERKVLEGGGEAPPMPSSTNVVGTASASEVEQHLDHVLEALVRARGIAMPRSRCVDSSGMLVFFFFYSCLFF